MIVIKQRGNGALYLSVENLIIPIFRVYIAHVRIYAYVYCGKYNNSSVKRRIRHPSNFLREISLRDGRARGSTFILKTFIRRRSRWRTAYTCSIRTRKYTHTHEKAHKSKTPTCIQRDVALIIEKRTTECARPENCGPSSRLLHIRVLLPKARGKEGQGDGASFTEVELSRTTFATSFLLDFTSSRAISARAARKRILDFFGMRGETFPDVRRIYACTYRGPERNLFAINLGEKSNAISRIEFSSGAEKIWVSVRVSPLQETPELANINLKKKKRKATA